MATEGDKDPAAQSLAHKRWRDVSAEERSRLMSRAAKIGIAKLSKKRRSEIARNAALAHWGGLTPEQRSAEMKRRAGVRKRNRVRKPKLGLNSNADVIQALIAVKNDVYAALGRPRR